MTTMDVNIFETKLADWMATRTADIDAKLAIRNAQEPHDEYDTETKTKTKTMVKSRVKDKTNN